MRVVNVYVIMYNLKKKLLTRPCFRSSIRVGEDREREKTKEGKSCPPMRWIQTRVLWPFDDDPHNY